MKHRHIFITVLLAGLCSIARGQTSLYWFDDDIDGGKKSSVANGTIQTDISFLTEGAHVVHYVYIDRNGIPSATFTQAFIIPGPKAKTAVSGEYWFDDDYSKRVCTSTLNGVISVDASGLAPGLHSLYYQQKDADGLPSAAFGRNFLVPEPEVTAASKGEYWFDDDFANRRQLALSTNAVGIDLSGLEPGLHTVYYHALNADGLPSVAYSQMFWIGSDTEIAAYHYWVNDDGGNITSVRLETPVNPYSLVAKFDVPALPIRTVNFHFEMVSGKPMAYAKNTMNIQFENTVGGFQRIERDYVDYRVGQAIQATLLNPGDQKTVGKTDGLQWFMVTASKGDSLAFKANRRCAMQLFSSATGTELWSTDGDNALRVGGCRADGNGTFYLALHDVTDSGVNDVTIEYQWEARPIPPGDVNGDYSVDVADIATVITVMAGESGSTDPLQQTADVNGDGVVDVADIASVISIMAEMARMKQLTEYEE